MEVIIGNNFLIQHQEQVINNKLTYWVIPELNFYKLSFGFLLIFLFIGCSINDSTENPKTSELKFIKEFDLAILEPSGLTFNKNYDVLYAVSDNNNKVYEINLNGSIISELNYQGNDLEGVTFDNTSNSLWIAEERLREVVNIDLKGNELTRKKINISGSNNNGLEGICFDTTGTMYLLNEKQPKLWIKLKKNFSIEKKSEINNVGDLSGIAYDKKHKVFWIVSDESQKLFQWNQNNGIMKSFDLSYPKAEGIAYNYKTNKIYIVSDKTSKLYVYQLSD